MVEVEDDVILEELEKELEDIDFEDSEGEAEEYASLPNNENDD